MFIYWRRYFLLAWSAILVIGLFFASADYSSAAESDHLKDKYAANEFKIMIVPGHDDDSAGGAVFRGLREADLNLKIAEELKNLFDADAHFKALITRNKAGYISEFSRYFADNYSDIVSFRENSRKIMDDLVERGVIQRNITILHNYASEKDSLRLYGINKWASENGSDLVLHLHFNDYPGRAPYWAGEYSGFSIYIPEKQLPNHGESLGIAESIFASLQKYFPVSDLPVESAGIIEDQELIAVGPASFNGAAILIEYGYIYEPQFVNSRTQSSAIKELAHQTYLGVKKYFEPNESAKDTAMLPYEWNNHLKKGLKNNRDVIALQVALSKEGLYPPEGSTKNKCGITGNFGECTQRAAIEFQRKHNLPQTGFIGDLTIARLNELYFYEPPKSAEDFSYSWAKDLYFGLKNSEDVRALQNALFLEGVYSGPISGNFSDATRKAVVEFQKKHNFVSTRHTGYAGVYTREVLNSIYSRQPNSLLE